MIRERDHSTDVAEHTHRGNTVEFADREAAQEKILEHLDSGGDGTLNIKTSSAYDFATDFAADLDDHL